MSIRRQASVICCAITVAKMCLAQTVTGRVTTSDAAPAVGTVVTAIDATGAGIARAVVTETGTYSLVLPRAGSYRVRALRLGYRPEVSAAFDLAPSEVHKLDLVMLVIPVALDSVSVADRADCNLRGVEAQTFLQLWERARDALAAAQLLERGRFEVWSVGEFGHVDRNRMNGRSDSVIVRQSATGAAIAATAGVVRAIAVGYVRRVADGPPTYEAPTPNDLLSDEFMSRHCFSIKAAPPGHPEWIGIGYAPIGDYSWVDIAGTIWLDRNATILRRVEFRYTHLDAPDKLCALESTELLCMAPSPAAAGSVQPGGYVDFVSLPSGAWLATDREIWTQVDTMFWSRVYNARSALDRRLFAPIFLRSTTSWKVASVLRDGTEVYRDDRATNIVNRAISSRAGRHPSAIDGVVTDTAGHRISGVVVSVVDPQRATITNDSGFFQIRALPAEHLELRVGCPRHATVTQQVTLTRDSTQHLAFNLALDGLIPDSASLTRATCPAR